MLQSKQSSVMDEPETAEVPSFKEIGAWYERLLDLAPALLSGSVSTRVRSWEDGEFEVRVWHKFESPEPGAFRKEVLRYHSREDAVVAAVLEVERESGGETLLFKTDLDPDGVPVDAEKIRDRVGDD